MEFLYIIYALYFLGGVFWIWMFIDVLTGDFDDGFTKIIWILVVLFLNGFGAVLYYFVGRKQKVY